MIFDHSRKGELLRGIVEIDIFEEVFQPLLASLFASE